MFESNDTMTALLISAWSLHCLTLTVMVQRTALEADQSDSGQAQQRPLAKVLRGRAPLQRTGRDKSISRLLAVSGLGLTAASVVGFATAAPLAWTIILAVLAATEFASAYAWHRSADANPTDTADQPAGDGSERATDSDIEEVTKTEGPGES